MLKSMCVALALAGFACQPAARTVSAFVTPTASLGKTGRVESVRVVIRPVDRATAVFGTLIVRERAYEVFVRFDDGSAGIFDYADVAPFSPGERVVVLDNGLAHG